MGTYIMLTEKNLATRPCPTSLQTESRVFALLALDWLTCTTGQRSPGLQTTSKEPQIFKSGLETIYAAKCTLAIHKCVYIHKAYLELNKFVE